MTIHQSNQHVAPASPRRTLADLTNPPRYASDGGSDGDHAEPLTGDTDMATANLQNVPASRNRAQGNTTAQRLGSSGSISAHIKGNKLVLEIDVDPKDMTSWPPSSTGKLTHMISTNGWVRGLEGRGDIDLNLMVAKGR